MITTKTHVYFVYLFPYFIDDDDNMMSLFSIWVVYMSVSSLVNRFAAALIDLPVWVMNVVPVNGPNTLLSIFDRGLIGIYHDWCEAFNTYPRTYDLLHCSFLFGNITHR